MKKRVYLMCGAPGSGKSTFLQTHNLGKSYSIISRDKIRFSLVREDEEYFSKETEVFDSFIELAKEALKEVDDVYMDATHLNCGSRIRTLNALGDSLKDIEVCAIFFTIPIDICLKRNEERQGTRAYVPPTVVKRMCSQRTAPEFREGFDKIYIVDSNNNVTEIARCD